MLSHQPVTFEGEGDEILQVKSSKSVETIRGHTTAPNETFAKFMEVPGQMKRWHKAGGKVLRGLERRREAEAAWYAMEW